LGDDNNTVTLRKFRKNHANALFLGDVLGLITLQATANLNFHAGYELIFLNSIACAPDQVDKNTGSHSGRHLDASDPIMIQGVLAGINLGF
jgi:hypothetical protein